MAAHRAVTTPIASGSEAECPETRVKALDVLSWPRIGVRSPESPEPRWENRLKYDGKAVGTVLARYYDPSTGQFLTVDPDVAFTWSPYGYAAGNPVNRLDPSGVDPWDPNGRYAATPQLQPHPWNDVPPLCAGTSPTPVQSTPVLVPTLPFPDAGSGNPPREDR